MSVPHRKYLLVLSVIFAMWWAILAIRPWDRDTWLVENALAIAAAAFLIGYNRTLVLSRVSYTLIFIFMCLHQVGAHYSYAEVPYDVWFERLTGTTFNELVGWERNNFDRVVHFSYGLLLAYPVREIFLRVADVRGFWGYFLPLDLTMSTSALFELIEWGAAEVFGGELGQAYPRHAGRHLGRAQGHGACESRRADCDAHHLRAEPALPARLQPRMGGQPAREAQSAARGRCARAHAAQIRVISSP